MKSIASCVLIVMSIMTGSAPASQCKAMSGERRVPLLELYTSEGCNSCPPTDRWVSGLAARHLTSDRVVTLAFHVDYWNYLGWTDRFAQARFSERQRWTSAHNHARFVYTPQLVLNGRDYRSRGFRDDFANKVSAINKERPGATITFELDPAHNGDVVMSGMVTVGNDSARNDIQAYIALYENKLSSSVTAGENRGKQLMHDYVVRDLVGPLSPGADGRLKFRHRFELDHNWKRPDLHTAAFVQNPRSGEVLQSLSLRLCN